MEQKEYINYQKHCMDWEKVLETGMSVSMNMLWNLVLGKAILYYIKVTSLFSPVLRISGLEVHNFFNKIDAFLWYNFGTILGQFWGNFGTILGQFWDNFGTIWGQFLDNFWIISWKFRYNFGTILGQFWDNFGTILGQFWDNFGTIYWKFRDKFGIIYD